MAKHKRVRGQPKLNKDFCEICKTTNRGHLDIHHVIPRCDERSHNNNSNLVVLCANCHDLIHSGEIIIIGVYSSTSINGRTILFFNKGEEPPIDENLWLVKENNKVITR